MWLYLALWIHINYHFFHSLKLYKFCNIYPRSINSLLGIVLMVTNLTKVLWSLTTIDLLITVKVLFWTWLFRITLTASASIFQSFTYLKSTEGRCIIYFLIHINYHFFHSLKVHKFCNVYPRSINSLLGIVLTVTNLTKVLWSLTTMDLLINVKVLFWAWLFRITLTASASIFQSFTYLKSTEGRCIIYFLIHINYHFFHSLKVYKFFNIYPRSIKSLLGIVLTVTNLTILKIKNLSVEFDNDRFVDNCEVLFWTWLFRITLAASTSIFQSFTYLKSTEGECIVYF